MNNYFAENLKYLRESKGWSQSELSRQTVRVCNIHNKDLPKEKHIKPITQASIARWEAGKNSPSIDNLVVLEETLFVRLPDLIGKNLKNKEEEKIKLSKEQEQELLKEVLKKKGFLDENEELSEENFNMLINFAKANKQFIMKDNNKE